MKVLLLTTESSLMDGINRHVATIAAGLVVEGAEVAVCTTHGEGDLTHEVRKGGARIYMLNCNHGHDPRMLWRFYRVIREFNPDVVHIHCLALMERIVLSVFFNHARKILTIHAIQDPIKRVSFKSRVEVLLTRMFEIDVRGKIFISQGVARALSNEDNPRVVYNPMGKIESPNDGKLRKELGLSSDAKVVGTACRIAEVKNPQAFTRVMVEVTKRVAGTHAIIIGDGEAGLMAELRKIAVDAPNVHFLGYRTDARQLISECDCFVMTSAREGMPTAMLEAMSAGVPVAFWRGEGGLIDLAELNEREGRFGVIVDQGDELGLVDGVCRILNTGFVGNGRKVVADHFALSTVSRQLKCLYESVLSDTYVKDR